MSDAIKKVAVIGAGAMGAGIAAQVANAGLPVVLLDKFAGTPEKNIAKLLAGKGAAAGFMSPENAKLITTGTMDRDIEKIADCDLIIEAVYEDLNVKHETFALLEKHKKPGAIIASNTSTLKLEDLTRHMGAETRQNMAGAHFFNPPRYARLLELIGGPDTAPETLARLRDFGDRVLGKKIVLCKDQPGFIANRLGVFMIERARAEAVKYGVGIEGVDAIFSTPLGFPKTGIFKLADFVGLDILQHAARNMNAGLPETDEFRRIYDPSLIDRMVADKRLGDKSGAGFYRRHPDGSKEAVDLATGEYRPARNSRYFNMNVGKKYGGLNKFLEADDSAGKFVWPVLRDTLLYALDHAEDIAFDLQSVDDAMKAGFGWDRGPFELIDKLGPKWFAQKLAEDGIAQPMLLRKAAGKPFYRVESNVSEVMNFSGAYEPLKREEGIIKLDDFKRGRKPLVSHNSAKLWDIGDGVACLEFCSKANALDPSVMYVLNESLKLIESSEGKYKAMVIYNDGENFSVGANLVMVDMFNKAANTPFAMIADMAKPLLKAALPKALGKAVQNGIASLDKPYMALGGKYISRDLNRRLEEFVNDFRDQGQTLFKAMREAPIVTVAAIRRKAWGGACEFAMHCDTIQASAETSIGLVEFGVRIIPAFGGCARYLERALAAGDKIKGPMIAFKKAVMALARPDESVSTSAQDARHKLWLRPGDGITMNDDRLFADAKAKALAMIPGYRPPAPATFNLPGAGGKAAIRMSMDSLYFKGDDPKNGVNHIDVAVVDRLAHVLSGGDTLAEADLEAHTTNAPDDLRGIFATRPDKCININPSLTLTERRILDLEGEALMALFRTEATKTAIAHTMATKKPLREDRPDPAPTPKEIRQSLEHDISLPRRTSDGQPLHGRDQQRVQSMATTTARFYKLGRIVGLV